MVCINFSDDSLFSCVLAQSVLSVFPHAKIVDYHKCALGFYVDFTLPKIAFHSEHIATIENAFLHVIKELDSEHIVEMTPYSAKELLHYKKISYLAHCFKDTTPTVHLLRTDDNVLPLYKEPCQKNTEGEFTFFQIDEFPDTLRFNFCS